MALPLARETLIEVRWRGGGFVVHGSPWDLDAFAAGHLVAEGFVPAIRGIRSIAVREVRDRVRVDVELARPTRQRGTRLDNVVMGFRPDPLPGGGRRPRDRVRAEDLLSLARILRDRERSLRAAGPLHWAGLYDPRTDDLLMASDVSRHSAMDKVIGKALLGQVPIAGRFLYSTGRIGGEMAAKAVRVDAAALATRSVPFRAAAEVAQHGHLVLVGKLQPSGFWVYAGRGLLQASRGRPRGRGDRA